LKILHTKSLLSSAYYFLRGSFLVGNKVCQGWSCESHRILPHRDSYHRSAYWPGLQQYRNESTESSSTAAVHPTSSARSTLGQQEHLSLASTDASPPPVVVGLEHSSLIRRSRMGTRRYVVLYYTTRILSRSLLFVNGSLVFLFFFLFNIHHFIVFYTGKMTSYSSTLTGATNKLRAQS